MILIDLFFKFWADQLGSYVKEVGDDLKSHKTHIYLVI